MKTLHINRNKTDNESRLCASLHSLLCRVEITHHFPNDGQEGSASVRLTGYLFPNAGGAGAEASSTRVLWIFLMWSAGTSDGLGDRNESFISPFGRSRLKDEAFKKTVVMSPCWSCTCSNDWSMCRRALRTKTQNHWATWCFLFVFSDMMTRLRQAKQTRYCRKKKGLFFLVFLKQSLCVSFYIWPGRFKR